MSRVALAVALCVVSGCYNSDPREDVIGACVALTIDGSGSVDTLRLSLSGAAQADRIAPVQQTLATLPVYVALQLTHATSSGGVFTGGDVRIDVAGQRAGMIVGSGSTHLMVGSSDHVKASLTLGSGPLPAVDDLATEPIVNDLSPVCSTADSAVLASDPHNCGACGHDCLGGTCMLGVCQPMVLATSNDQVGGIAVDAANVYFSRISGTTRGVARQPLAGGAPVTIYSSPLTPIYGLAVVGSTLFVDDSHAHLETLPAPAGASTLTAGYDGSVTTFATDSSNVYFANNADYVVRSLGIALSGTPADVVTLTLPAVALASDGTTLFYATNSDLGAVTLPVGTQQTFGSFSGARALAVDGNTLWVATNNSVVHLSHTASAYTLLSTVVSQSTPTAIAVDAKAVYWTNQGDSTVMRLAR